MNVMSTAVANYPIVAVCLKIGGFFPKLREFDFGCGDF